MKKIIYIIITLAIFTSCVVDDNVEENNYKGDVQTYFTGISLNKDVIISSTTSDINTVEVGSTITTESDRTYSITVDESSTAIEGIDYTLDNTIAVIKANEYVGFYEFKTLFNSMQDESVLVLNLSQINDFVSSFKNQITINFSKACDTNYVSSLVDGTSYSVTTTYGFHDFLSDYPSNTMITQITDLGDNSFSFPDFSGGLYSTGPYNGAYGTGGVDNSITFTDECNKIVWEDQTDPWGAIVPLDGGVNKIDATTGVITISWYCEGYGENGVSVYTPQ